MNSMLLAIHSTDSLQDKLCYGWSDYKTCSHINCQECLKNTSQDLCLIRKYYSVIRRKGAYFIGIFNVKKRAERITQIGLFWMKFQALDILIKHSFGCMSSNKDIEKRMKRREKIRLSELLVTFFCDFFELACCLCQGGCMCNVHCSWRHETFQKISLTC